jgi:hypothetical protein
MVYLYYEFALQGRMLRVVYMGVLGFRLIMVYLYYEFPVHGMRLRVFKREY